MKRITGVDVQLASHQKLLKYRKADRLIQEYTFIEAWDLANDNQKKAVLKLIKRGRYKAIRDWIVNRLKGDLWQLNIYEVRALARKHAIKNYSRTSKETLIKILIEEQE